MYTFIGCIFRRHICTRARAHAYTIFIALWIFHYLYTPIARQKSAMKAADLSLHNFARRAHCHIVCFSRLSIFFLYANRICIPFPHYLAEYNIQANTPLLLLVWPDYSGDPWPTFLPLLFPPSFSDFIRQRPFLQTLRLAEIPLYNCFPTARANIFQTSWIHLTETWNLFRWRQTRKVTRRIRSIDRSNRAIGLIQSF